MKHSKPASSRELDHCTLEPKAPTDSLRTISGKTNVTLDLSHFKRHCREKAGETGFLGLTNTAMNQEIQFFVCPLTTITEFAPTKKTKGKQTTGGLDEEMEDLIQKFTWAFR